MLVRRFPTEEGRGGSSLGQLLKPSFEELRHAGNSTSLALPAVAAHDKLLARNTMGETCRNSLGDLTGSNITARSPRKHREAALIVPRGNPIRSLREFPMTHLAATTPGYKKGRTACATMSPRRVMFSSARGWADPHPGPRRRTGEEAPEPSSAALISVSTVLSSAGLRTHPLATASSARSRYAGPSSIDIMSTGRP